MSFFDISEMGPRDLLYRAIGSIDVQEQVRMSGLTSFRIGGPADYVVAPDSVKEVVKALHVLNEQGIPYIVIGRGTNLLVSDEGFRGAVIRIGGTYLQHVEFKGTTMICEAGLPLLSIAKTAMRHGLAGMEFAAGIPGSLGGGIFMNAGAYGGELSQIVKDVTVVDINGKIRTIPGSELGFGYRSSILQSKSWIIVSATLQLKEDDPKAIEARMEELAQARKDKQPLDLPSAGSAFKRPEGHFAGALIEQAGLKGYQIGGAQVSTKHAGFIVNQGGATCKDVLELIRYIQKTVSDKFGVRLEPEIRYLSPYGLDRI